MATVRRVEKLILSLLEWPYLGYIIVVAATFLLSGFIYLTVHPDLFGRLGVLQSSQFQSGVEALMVLLSMGIGFVGFFFIFNAKKYEYNLRYASTVMASGAILVLLAIIMLAAMLAAKGG